MSTAAFFGTGVAIVTPFLQNGEIDWDGLKKLIHHLSAGKVDYLVVMGTTGENVALSKVEKQQIFQFVAANNVSNLPLVAGMGGNYTKEVLDNLSSVNLEGYQAILSVSPYYNKPNQQGIIYHYNEVANASPLPIILYNVPGRTGSNMTDSTQLELAKHPNIVATKEASGNMEQVMSILKDKPSDFLVISGDDALTFPILACGGSGVISVINHIFPRTFSGMVKSALQGDIIAARASHERVLESSIAIFADGSPGGIKTMLHEKQLCGTAVRPPLWQVNAQVDENLRKLAHTAD